MLHPDTIYNFKETSKFLFVPTNENELDQLVKILDDVTDLVRDDETHPLMNMMDVIGVLIETYESEHIPEPPPNPVQILKHFMQEYGLDEDDLPEIGDRTEILAILHGLQPLLCHHAEALSKRFDVSKKIFLTYEFEYA